LKNYPCLVTWSQECFPPTLNIYIVDWVSAEDCLLCKQGEGEGVGTEEKVEILKCTNDEQLNPIPSSAEEFIDNTLSRDGRKPCEVDSTKDNSEDNTDAAWWNMTLQRNAENELLDSLDDEANTDIRFKLPSSSDSGISWLS